MIHHRFSIRGGGKRHFVAFLVINFWLGLWIWSCQKPEPPGAEKDPHPPEVRIIDPVDGAVWTQSDTIRIEASDDERIERVVLFIDGQIVMEFTHSPYAYLWHVGYWADDLTHELRATAYDTDNNESTSDPIRVTIPKRAAFRPRIFRPTPDTLFKNPGEIQFRWSSLPDVANYELQMDRSENFSNPQTFFPQSYRYTLTDIQEGRFYWRVRGKNHVGKYSEWSEVIGFSILFVVTARFSDIEEKVFARSCALANCHTGDFPAQGLNLSPGLAYQNLVNVPSFEVPSWMLVEPYRSDRSYLITKIEGGDSLKGGLMPLNGPRLHQEVIDSIRAWIDQGALDN